MSTFQKMKDTVGVIRYTPPISVPIFRQLPLLRVSKHIPATLTLAVTRHGYMILLEWLLLPPLGLLVVRENMRNGWDTMKPD